MEPIATIGAAAELAPRQPNSSGLVLLMHGFAANRWWMNLLQRRLLREGFRTRNWGYSSLYQPVVNHADRLRALLEGELSSEPRVHVVAHSMGAIVTRAALSSGVLPNIGRIVFLAPPNHGSPMARVIQSSIGRVCKPIADLSDRADSFVNTLPRTIEAEVGIIAARYDHLVPVANTHLPEESDHIVLPATHSSLLFSRAAVTQVNTFLLTGRLAKET